MNLKKIKTSITLWGGREGGSSDAEEVNWGMHPAFETHPRFQAVSAFFNSERAHRKPISGASAAASVSFGWFGCCKPNKFNLEQHFGHSDGRTGAQAPSHIYTKHFKGESGLKFYE